MTDTRKLIYQHTISVPEHSRGVRLDKWLAEIFPETSRSRLRGLIEQGFVKNAKIQTSKKVVNFKQNKPQTNTKAM